MGGTVWPNAVTPFTVTLSLAIVLSQTLQFGVPIYLLVRRQPRRPHFGRRMLASFLALMALGALTTLASYVGMAYPQVGHWRYVINFATYSLYLLCFVPAILACYDTSVWNAVFAVCSGYTIQNIGTGVGQLVEVVYTRAASEALSVVAAITLPNVSVALSVAAFYYLYIRHADGIGRLTNENRDMLTMVLLVILVVIANDVLIRGLGNEGLTSTFFLVALRLAHLAVCCFVLFAEYEMVYNARLRVEVATTERMAAERERQYELSRENIDAINVKCHDIRHQIRHLIDGTGGFGVVDRYVLDDIAREVRVYDSAVRTGNEALDTILTEKSLVCQREGITLTCVADGAALGFMTPADIYSLFGNALDNAVEAVRALDDPERRTISLTVRSVGSLVTVHVENYYAGERTFVDGLPQTTATENREAHGFGTKSMRSLVERYGGTLTLDAEGGTFRLNALIPQA